MATKVPSAWRELFETVLVCVLSAAFGIAFTAGLAATADANNWCCVHSWALAHGSGAVVFLLSALAGFHIVRTIGSRLEFLTPAPQFGVLAHAAYVFGALGTLNLYRATNVAWARCGGSCAVTAFRWPECPAIRSCGNRLLYQPTQRCKLGVSSVALPRQCRLTSACSERASRINGFYVGRIGASLMRGVRRHYRRSTSQSSCVECRVADAVSRLDRGRMS
jgi:hypothetical protein